jgi:hypothetical protein
VNKKHDSQIASLQEKVSGLESQLNEKANRTVIDGQLAILLFEGRRLFSQCRKEQEPVPDATVSKWLSQTMGFLMNSLGIQYAARWNGVVEQLPIEYTSSSANHRSYCALIYPRLQKLEEFLKERVQG